VDVDGKVITSEEGLLVALLRFGEHAKVHEHAGETETLVACLEGEGFTSVGSESTAIRAGDRVRWPRDVVHGLWTSGSTMLTLMIERR
jgi:quercetin dioxygenase-like cupin family protein